MRIEPDTSSSLSGIVPLCRRDPNIEVVVYQKKPALATQKNSLRESEPARNLGLVPNESATRLSPSGSSDTVDKSKSNALVRGILKTSPSAKGCMPKREASEVSKPAERGLFAHSYSQKLASAANEVSETPHVGRKPIIMNIDDSSDEETSEASREKLPLTDQDQPPMSHATDLKLDAPRDAQALPSRGSAEVSEPTVPTASNNEASSTEERHCAPEVKIADHSFQGTVQIAYDIVEGQGSRKGWTQRRAHTRWQKDASSSDAHKAHVDRGNATAPVVSNVHGEASEAAGGIANKGHAQARVSVTTRPDTQTFHAVVNRIGRSLNDKWKHNLHGANKQLSQDPPSVKTTAPLFSSLLKQQKDMQREPYVAERAGKRRWDGSEADGATPGGLAHKKRKLAQHHTLISNGGHANRVADANPQTNFSNSRRPPIGTKRRNKHQRKNSERYGTVASAFAGGVHAGSSRTTRRQDSSSTPRAPAEVNMHTYMIGTELTTTLGEPTDEKTRCNAAQNVRSDPRLAYGTLQIPQYLTERRRTQP
jgi:hypothetical protein